MIWAVRRYYRRYSAVLDGTLFIHRVDLLIERYPTSVEIRYFLPT